MFGNALAPARVTAAAADFISGVDAGWIASRPAHQCSRATDASVTTVMPNASHSSGA